MTYKTRQEVLRAAADWMDVCENAGVEAKCKLGSVVWRIASLDFKSEPSDYEFPLALLEGKEVWVGSELYQPNGHAFIVEESHKRDSFCMYPIRECSWNPPKPKTVMVELPMRLVEFRAGRIELNNDEHDTLLLAEDDACKKALEKL